MTTSTNEQMGLVDTNILVYRADQNSVFHLPSMNLIDRGFRGDISLCLAPQNLTEFYIVARKVIDCSAVVRLRFVVGQFIACQNGR